MGGSMRQLEMSSVGRDATPSTYMYASWQQRQDDRITKMLVRRKVSPYSGGRNFNEVKVWLFFLTTILLYTYCAHM